MVRAEGILASCNDGFGSWPLTLFHEAVEAVPAYRRFLSEHGTEPSAICSMSDFVLIPRMSKVSYLSRYGIASAVRHDEHAGHVISSSSGSSGAPTYWPRNNLAVEQAAHLHEEALAPFLSLKKSTLLVIAFAMGNWIGGTYTFQAAIRLTERGYPISIISPGIAKAEVVHALRDLSGSFEQTILAAYPPFAKDVLDQATREGVELASLNLKLLCAGEAFSETWRTHVSKLVAAPSDTPSVVSIYGTADAGAIAYETPLTLWLRHLFDVKPDLREDIFTGTQATPMLFQFNPAYRYLEESDGKLLFTVNNALPLIRYEIGDEGQILCTAQLRKIFDRLGLRVPPKLQGTEHLPFVALYRRSDVAASFYGLNIYPENIKAGLEEAELIHLVTGKFQLETRTRTECQSPELHLLIELQPSVIGTDDLRQQAQALVVRHLRAHNSEYNRLCQELGDAAFPHVHFAEAGTPEFAQGIKQQWTKR